jgi:hypothetical protein
LISFFKSVHRTTDQGPYFICVNITFSDEIPQA